MNVVIKNIRILGLAGLAVAATLALPSAAQAGGKAHLLKTYKVERQLDLSGEDGTYTVACNNNDLALDGMWRVDNVDQDPDYVYDGPGGSWSTMDPPDHFDWDLLRSVRPVEAARASDSSYDFMFTPLAGADVSMKLWVTCLRDTSTQVDGHTVSWAITTGGAPIAAVTTNALTTSPSCGSGFVAVQPSFTVTAGDADLVASYPSADARAWNWRFENVQPGFSATVSIHCLALRSSAGPGGHRHRIVKRFATRFNPADAVRPASVDTKQALCGEHYKGLIGGWDVSGVFGQVYYLGMDPRIKHRVFRFVNRDTVQHDPPVYLVCFKDKTT